VAAIAGLNLALAFALELAMLAAFGYFGYSATQQPVARWLLAFALPLATAAVWAVILAPKASHRLAMVPGMILSLVLFTLAAFALFSAGRQTLAIVMFAAAWLHAGLAFVLRQW